MTIVHVHIERTGGVFLQDLYERKYPGSGMLWYNTRDNLFAPFNIKTANYTKNWQLKLYAFIARRLPSIRFLMIKLRTWRRKRQAVPLKNLSSATVVIGHFAVNKILPYLPSNQHEYRTVIRDPLARMWSHFNHFQAHRGDVGQRVVPEHRENMTFEEFAMLPEMKNYQTQAIGLDLSIYKHIGITEKLESFCKNTGLTDKASSREKINHFGNALPELTQDFLKAFKIFHDQDYRLYNSVLKINASDPHTSS
ncbi:hypothetical protein KKA39_02440 [Patescibacteria group bacterium]|nr:hypothetical protein [Patescibacteria group bacterium]MBU1728135.1 hypothetical protein [Patescibacteria group bacterium]